MEQVPISLKNVSPAIPKKESELKELIEDLSRMGCGRLLAKPSNLRAGAMLREFMFERGNHWFRTIKQDPEKWMPEVWAEVYGFPPGKGEGWASHRDSFHVGKLWTDPYPKAKLRPGDCRNPRERSMIEFILPILSPKRPKCSTLPWPTPCSVRCPEFALSNWGRIIQGYVEKSLPHIGRKPSFLSPYILHLY